MISQSPTQQPPEETTPETKKVEYIYASKQRAGQKPAARFVKAIFHPIFKGIYYLLRGMRNHKLVSLIMILLILGSAIGVNYAVSGEWPFGIGNDPFNFHVHGSKGGGEQVQNWLYALRDGNVLTLSLLDRYISQPPDPQQLVDQLSQPKAHLSWKAINVVGVAQESDTTIDSLIEVDLSTNGPSGRVSGYAIFHFVTVAQQGGAILSVNVLNVRAAQG